MNVLLIVSRRCSLNGRKRSADRQLSGESNELIEAHNLVIHPMDADIVAHFGTPLRNQGVPRFGTGIYVSDRLEPLQRVY